MMMAALLRMSSVVERKETFAPKYHRLLRSSACTADGDVKAIMPPTPRASPPPRRAGSRCQSGKPILVPPVVRYKAEGPPSRRRLEAGLRCNPGNDLLFHTVARAVPSAQEGLTS